MLLGTKLMPIYIHINKISDKLSAPLQLHFNSKEVVLLEEEEIQQTEQNRTERFTIFSISHRLSVSVHHGIP